MPEEPEEADYKIHPRVPLITPAAYNIVTEGEDEPYEVYRSSAACACPVVSQANITTLRGFSYAQLNTCSSGLTSSVAVWRVIPEDGREEWEPEFTRTISYTPYDGFESRKTTSDGGYESEGCEADTLDDCDWAPFQPSGWGLTPGFFPCDLDIVLINNFGYSLDSYELTYAEVSPPPPPELLPTPEPHEISNGDLSASSRESDYLSQKSAVSWNWRVDLENWPEPVPEDGPLPDDWVAWPTDFTYEGLIQWQEVEYEYVEGEVEGEFVEEEVSRRNFSESFSVTENAKIWIGSRRHDSPKLSGNALWKVENITLPPLPNIELLRIHPEPLWDDADKNYKLQPFESKTMTLGVR